jgi:hypothetical protein
MREGEGGRGREGEGGRDGERERPGADEQQPWYPCMIVERQRGTSPDQNRTKAACRQAEATRSCGNDDDVFYHQQHLMGTMTRHRQVVPARKMFSAHGPQRGATKIF